MKINPDIHIRPARAQDQAIIRSFIYRARLNPLGLSWESFRMVEAADGEVIGCGQLKPHHDGVQELASLYVKPAFRGRGIAARLIRDLQNQARSDLWLTCRSGLIPFYERFGFQDVADPDSMPLYFQRIWKIVGFFTRWFPNGDRLAVMYWSGMTREA